VDAFDSFGALPVSVAFLSTSSTLAFHHSPAN